MILARKILIYNNYKKITFIILTLRSPDDNILLVLVIKYQIHLMTGETLAFLPDDEQSIWMLT
ncbi:hypothetical protein J2T19_002205 [Paenibacillus tundrae]|uniref:Uncharacterized protein n=1 Tax=Paenibacillus tundrae TaxID=528187 RepID=A0ABT9WBY0_9BACL|nr:hypothetical protein [Paenibacillus tundrae]